MELLASNYDIIFLSVIIVSAILALIKGAIAELLSLSTWFIAFAVMHRYGSLIDSHIPSSISNQLIRSGIIFIIAFIIIAIVVAIIKKLCTNIISSIGLGSLNRLLGLIFGAVRGILICAILVIIIEMLNFDSEHVYQKSRLYPVISPVVDWIAQAIPKKFNNLPKPPNLLLNYQ